MSILQIDNLTHGFGDRNLYVGAELALFKGEHMGVVGQNGTGKSTLLNILLGTISPSEGHIAWQRGARIGYLDQHAQLDPSLSIEQYLRTAFADLYEMERRLHALYQDMDTDASEKQLRQAATLQEALQARGFYALDSRIARVASGLGLTAIGMDRQLGAISGGQRTKAILARLLLTEPDVLLLDEPTNFLDTEHIRWLTGYLSGFAGSFMIVSHDFAFLDGITNCICDIEFQTIKKYHGRYSDFVRQKAHLREEYQRQYQAQQREVEKLEDYIARNKVRASTAKMARSRQKKLDKMQRLAPTTVQPKPQIAFAQLALTTSRALRVQALRVGYTHPLLPRIDFTVAGGEKIAVTGFNGIGKSTLLKTLTGQIPALAGRYAFDASVRLGYFEQDLRWPEDSASPLEIVQRAYPKLLPKEARRALARHGVKAEHVQRPIRTLSGGEQNKVKLCLLAQTPSNFLVLDEPTNHLDAETKQSLREAIEAFEGSVLLVCHEAAFFQSFIDRELSIESLLAAKGAIRQ